MNCFGINLWNWISRLEEVEISLIRKVSALGFTAVELPMTMASIDKMDQIMDAIKEEDLAVSFCLSMPMERDISSDDEATRNRAIQYLNDCLDTGGKYGVTTLSGAFYGGGGKRHFLPEQDKQREWDYAVRGIKKIAERAKKQGIFLGLEPLNRYRTSIVNTIDQGLRMVDDIGMNNVGILFDTYQANIEETDMLQALEKVLQREKLIHFHASANNRGAPGTGHILWESLAFLLKQYEYAGHITMETFYPKGPDPSFYQLAENQDVLAQTGIKNMKRIFS